MGIDRLGAVLAACIDHMDRWLSADVIEILLPPPPPTFKPGELVRHRHAGTHVLLLRVWYTRKERVRCRVVFDPTGMFNRYPTCTFEDHMLIPVSPPPLLGKFKEWVRAQCSDRRAGFWASQPRKWRGQ